MANASQRRRVVITGMGAVCCLGADVKTFWDALVEGRYGIRPITRFDPEPHRIKHAGEVSGFALDPNGGDPALQFLLPACRQALDQAEQAGGALDRRRTGAVTASNFGAMETTAATVLTAEAPGASAVLVRQVPMEAGAGLVRSELGLNGPSAVLSLSCASGNAAIGYAVDLIRAGAADAAVACGFDALSELVWSGLGALRTMTPDLLRPFDRRRNGTIFSEGAGAVLVESAVAAQERGAEPLAEVLGHATNNNAFHLTHPDKEGAGLARAILAALADAGLAPECIDHVSAHGTGTKFNDSIETRAIKHALGDHARRIPVSSIKSMVGHAMGAASGLEAIAAVMTMRESVVPPTIHLEEPDPECDLDYVPNQAVEREVRFCLSNSAGIGGPNSVVVLGSPRS